MAEVYRNCMVCGKQFKVCNVCHKSVPEELQWRRVVCCPQHFAFHLPIIRYVRKEISKSDARAEIENAVKNYGEIEYAEDIKPVVDDIFSD